MCQNFDQLEEKMKNCFQFQNMNMIDHGNMVHQYYSDLIGSRNYEWDFGKVGQMVDDLIPSAFSKEYMKNYQVYHDCGKPHCRTVDEQGKQHFPNHAQVSYNVWLQAGGDPETAWFILHDMDFHTLKGDDLNDILSDPRSISLLLTAWAEIHANAQMFGGIDSTSFKIKRKHLEKQTKLVHQELNKLSRGLENDNRINFKTET